MMALRFVPLRTSFPMLTWWQGKSRRERRILRVLAGLALIAVVWAGVWQPLQRDVRRLRTENAREQAALAQARRDVDDILQLQRTPLPPVTDGRADLERSLVNSGLRNAVTDLQWQQDRARVTFAAVDFAAMLKWLDALQRESGLVVHEATLSARIDPASVRAELVLGR